MALDYHMDKYLDSKALYHLGTKYPNAVHWPLEPLINVAIDGALFCITKPRQLYHYLSSLQWGSCPTARSQINK